MIKPVEKTNFLNAYLSSMKGFATYCLKQYDNVPFVSGYMGMDC